MKMKSSITALSTILLILVTGCSQKTVRVNAQARDKGRYDSEFPNADASRELESITHSICKVYSVTTYKTYYFKQGMEVTRLDLSNGNYLYKSFGIMTSKETTSGTATIIFHAFKMTALITCAHIMESPDTLISFYKTLEGENEQFISSISLKEKQENFIKELATCGTVDLLAIDPANDVAIIGNACEVSLESLEVLGVPAGRARDLRWGNFVYLLGYPLGSLMVTNGLVSIPRNDTSGGFMVDALFNKGFSGGIILALHDGIPNFEMVGMIRSVPSQKEYYIRPEKEINEKAYDENALYRGDLYVGKHEAITYGVTTVVPMETIRALYLKNRKSLQMLGYNLDGFFEPENPH
jgi:hypothetical protein